MIPILFDATETSFTSNGIGRLRDCIECVATEERNGKFECEFQYPITGKYYHDIVEGMYIYCIHDDTKVPQAFEIYARSAPMNGIVTFNARHISYKLNNIVLNPFSATTITEAFAKINGQSINANPFTFWTDKSTTANFKLLNPASVRSILGGSQGSILDVYGGEYKFDMLTVRLYNRRGQDTDVTIRYGKNLKDIEQKIDNGETYDAVVPYWRQEDNVVVLDEKIVKPTSRNKQDKLFALDLSGDFQNAPTQAQLRSTAQSYVDSNKPWVPSENIKIDFIQLWQTEQYKDVAVLQRVALCDTVNVYYPALGVTAEGVKVIETQYDVLLERYERMELGDARSSFAQTIMKKSELALSNALKNAITRSIMEQAISHATDMITGGLGGHMVIGFNANGQPEEILMMDTDDVQTAVNVWRWNMGGFGHSHTGYNGPFNDVALTADGQINANMITVGILNAVLIKAGILSDEAGKNYWNMETGEFQLASTATVGGKTVATIASDAVDAQTQQSIFNKLTNNGQTQGVYLKNGKLYINATYIDSGELNANLITAGTITDKTGNNYWNLTTGAMAFSGSFELKGGAVTTSIKQISYSIWYVQNNRLYHNDRTVYGLSTQGGSDYIAMAPNSAYPEFVMGGAFPRRCMNGKRYSYTEWVTYTQGYSDGRFEAFLIDTEAEARVAEVCIGIKNNGSGEISITCSDNTGIVLNENNFRITGRGKSLYDNSYGDLYWGSNKIASASSSSKRYKEDITDILDEVHDPHRLYNLPVKQFKYKDDATLQYSDMKGETITGFIAEDVEAIYPSAVIHNPDGTVESWDERRILPPMLKLIQEQKAKIDDLEARIAKLEALVAKLAE